MGFVGTLRQSTAVNVIIGPFVDSTDGDTEMTGLTIAQADVRLSKNAGADAQKNDVTTCAHEGDGFYMCELDATDSNTVGLLTLWVHVATALAVRHDFQVIEEAAYDAIYAASADPKADINVATIDAGAITAAAIATGAVDADALAADAVAEIADGVWDEDATGHQTGGTFGQAIGDPGADTNTIFKAVVTDATGATVGVDVAAVLADTGTDGVVLANDAITAAKIAANAITSSEIADGAITAAKFAAGAIDATAIANAAIDAATFAAGAIDAAALAADAGTEIATAVWAAATRSLTVLDEDSTTLDLDATIRGAVGLAAADLDTQLAALPTAGENADAVWDEDATGHQTGGTFGQAIGDPGADTTTIYQSVVTDAAGTNIAADIVAVKADTAAILVDTGTTLDGKIDTIDTNVDSILADTGTDGVVLANDAITAAKIAANAITSSEIADGAITAAKIATGAIDADAIAADAANEIADAFLDRDMSTGTDSGSTTVRTPRQALRALRNKVGIAAGTLTVTKEDDATASWTAAVTTTAGDPISQVDPAGP